MSGERIEPSLDGQVELEDGTVWSIRTFEPVDISTIEAEMNVLKVRDVHIFLQYEGRPLLQDGEPLRDGANRKRTVTIKWFAERFGMAYSTFQRRVFAERGLSPHANARPGGTRGVGRTHTRSRPIAPDDNPPRLRVIDGHSRSECTHCPEHCPHSEG